MSEQVRIDRKLLERLCEAARIFASRSAKFGPDWDDAHFLPPMRFFTVGDCRGIASALAAVRAEMEKQNTAVCIVCRSENVGPDLPKGSV